MSLITCPDCGTEVSDRAPSCLKCGAPIAAAERDEPKIDKSGAWCPNCGNRDSYRSRDSMGCLMVGLIILTLGLAIILWLLTPKSWHCRVCKHVWRG